MRRPRFRENQRLQVRPHKVRNQIDDLRAISLWATAERSVRSAAVPLLLDRSYVVN